MSAATLCLADADLRRPKLAEYLGLEGAVGLSDVLINRVGLHDVLQVWGRNRMTVLPAGSVPPNPSELLGSAAMKQLIDVLATRYDTILFDAPPLLSVTDAAILSKQASGAILVVAAGRVHKQQLAAAASAAAPAPTRVTNAVTPLGTGVSCHSTTAVVAAVTDAHATCAAPTGPPRSATPGC